MSKELESLNKIAYSYGYDENIKIIEKSLKALDIIKKKEVNVFVLLHSGNLKIYNDYCCYNEKEQLTQEEYDLLKEVLKDE